MELRYYQADGVEAIYHYLRTRAGNPCAVFPTGAGKSLIIAQLCTDAVTVWGGRVLVLAHVKELLEQNVKELLALCPTVSVGVYSAGLKRREVETSVVIAGIQSAYLKAHELGHFDLVLIDEAHLIPESGDGMYRLFLGALTEINPDIRVVGLTATPYRLGLGPICRPGAVLSDICYEVGVKELVEKAYLAPLVGKAALAQIDTAGLAVRKGEFDDAATEAAFCAGDEVAWAVAEIGGATGDRKSVLIFCQTVAHAKQVYAALSDWLNAKWLRNSVGQVYGDTDPDDRASTLTKFKAGELKYLINVGLLTTGFNARNVDCVCLLRATKSPGLYYQILGRGFRLAPGKADCLVLDFGTNIERHGPVDAINTDAAAGPKDDRPKGKVCPQCRLVSAIAVKVCPCGVPFPEPEPEPGETKHGGKASDADPLSGPPKLTEHVVQSVTYKVHRKKGGDDDTPKTLRVTYQVGLADFVEEWVCVEHHGFAEGKARAWWAARCHDEMPRSAVEACVAASHGLLAEPATIVVRSNAGERFPEIVKYGLAAKPDGPNPCADCGGVNRRIIVRPGNVVCGDCGRPHGGAPTEWVEHYGFFGEPNSKSDAGLLPGDATPGGAVTERVTTDAFFDANIPF